MTREGSAVSSEAAVEFKGGLISVKEGSGETDHISVMPEEVVSFLGREGTFSVLDATVGGGGHAGKLLESVSSIRLLLGLDRDESAIVRCKKRLLKFGDRIRLVHAPFYDIKEIAENEQIESFDAMLFDLGLSSFQLEEAERGFSFAKDGPLDMRMDIRDSLTAEKIVNNADMYELADIFRKYGEERNNRRYAKAIVRARSKKPIRTTKELSEIVIKATSEKEKRLSRINPSTKIFQALRIAVNDEIKKLPQALLDAIDLLAPGGRIAVISFHSLEDRIVKNIFESERPLCRCPRDLPVCVCGTPGRLSVLTKKPITPGEDEVAQNKRARSAKLRVAQRL